MFNHRRPAVIVRPLAVLCAAYQTAPEHLPANRELFAGNANNRDELPRPNRRLFVENIGPGATELVDFIIRHLADALNAKHRAVIELKRAAFLRAFRHFAG